MKKLKKDLKQNQQFFVNEVYIALFEGLNEIRIYLGSNTAGKQLASYDFPEERIDQANLVKFLVKEYITKNYQVSYASSLHKIFCTNIKEATKEKAEKEAAKREFPFPRKSQTLPVHLL